MHINQRGLDLLKKFEGCKLKAYKDPIGILTIGFGHTGLDVYEGLVISQEHADHLLQQDLETFEAVVSDLVKIPLNENQFSALVSLCYNIGSGNFRKSTLLKLLNQNQVEAAAQEFGKWVKAGGKVLAGLVSRREAEKELFLT